MKVRILKEEIKELNRVVDEFAVAMKEKLAEKARDGWCGWDDLEDGTELTRIKEKLGERVVWLLIGDDKQAVNVANFAMMIWYNDKEEQPVAED